MHKIERTRRTIAIVIAASLQVSGAVALFVLLRQPPMPLLERIRAQGELVVATRNTPSVLYEGANGTDGFEYALTQRLGEALGVKIRYVFPQTVDELLASVARGTVHMAAAGLTITPLREQRVRFSMPYQFVTEQLIYRRGSTRPRAIDDINEGDLHVVAGSSHDQTLLNLNQTDYPALHWQTHADVSTERLLSAVDQGQLRLTVADSNDAALNKRVYRHIAIAFQLSEPRPIAWAFSRSTDCSLLKASNRLLQSLEQNGDLRKLRARYYGHTGRLNFVGVREFWRAVRDRLPPLMEHFEHAARETGIDWRLLAAIGYQESHWQEDAVSPTGVRGIMMLTKTTAKQMNVQNRNDPAQSILGGARYLRVVENKIPERIPEPHRLWFTLAGYNVGFGHLEDARILTERDGADPDLWLDVKQRLPLLAKKKYYSTVRYGFARGREPVNYVDNIRNYYDLLVWFTTTDDSEARERLIAADS